MNAFIEIVVSLLILSVALLTLLSAQTKGLAQLNSSDEVNQATLLLLDGLGRKRVDSDWQTLVSSELPQGHGSIMPQLLIVQWFDKYDQQTVTLSTPRPVAH